MDRLEPRAFGFAVLFFGKIVPDKMNRIYQLRTSPLTLVSSQHELSVIPTEPRRSRGDWKNLERPLDSAGALLGVTE